MTLKSTSWHGGASLFVGNVFDEKSGSCPGPIFDLCNRPVPRRWTAGRITRTPLYKNLNSHKVTSDKSHSHFVTNKTAVPL